MKNTFNLKNSADFQNILKKGTWNPGDFMSLYLMKNGNDFNMMGIAVGKKFSKSSVKRNRVTRLIRESYRLHENIFNSGLDIVVIARNNAAKAGYAEIESALLHLGKLHKILKIFFYF